MIKDLLLLFLQILNYISKVPSEEFVNINTIQFKF